MVTLEKGRRYKSDLYAKDVALFWTGRYSTHMVYDHETGGSYFEADYDMPIMRMVGDDRDMIVDITELTEISEDAYCPNCGSTTCAHR